MFYELLDKHLESIGKQKRDGFCITQEKYDKIVECLKEKTGPIGIVPFARITDSTKPEKATIIVKQYVIERQVL